MTYAEAVREKQVAAWLSANPCSPMSDVMKIEPYYDRDGITIYHGDCVQTLHALGS